MNLKPKNRPQHMIDRLVGHYLQPFFNSLSQLAVLTRLSVSLGCLGSALYLLFAFEGVEELVAGRRIPLALTYALLPLFAGLAVAFLCTFAHALMKRGLEMMEADLTRAGTSLATAVVNIGRCERVPPAQEVPPRKRIGHRFFAAIPLRQVKPLFRGPGFYQLTIICCILLFLFPFYRGRGSESIQTPTMQTATFQPPRHDQVVVYMTLHEDTWQVQYPDGVNKRVEAADWQHEIQCWEESGFTSVLLIADARIAYRQVAQLLEPLKQSSIRRVFFGEQVLLPI